MRSFFASKLNKIFFTICFLFCLPLFTQAATCTDSGGTCINTGSCKQIQAGTYDPCASGTVCCSPSGIITPIDAAAYQEGSTGGFLLLKGHLVPCGRQTNDPGTPTNETESCTLCHLFLLLKNVFDLMLSLLIVTAILLLTIGGVVYIVSMGNPSLVGIAKNIITKTLIGFALMLAGWLLVFTLLTFLSTGNMVGKGTTSWFEFTCDTNSQFDQLVD
ncbi:MAG: hypothetical protein KAQ63_00045 [Candidatus Moranbacteria bacterium]|nr:hypothetical protein [Candidatus Moranbacteria bacterium]